VFGEPVVTHVGDNSTSLTQRHIVEVDRTLFSSVESAIKQVKRGNPTFKNLLDTRVSNRALGAVSSALGSKEKPRWVVKDRGASDGRNYPFTAALSSVFKSFSETKKCFSVLDLNKDSSSFLKRFENFFSRSEEKIVLSYFNRNGLNYNVDAKKIDIHEEDSSWYDIIIYSFDSFPTVSMLRRLANFGYVIGMYHDVLMLKSLVYKGSVDEKDFSIECITNDTVKYSYRGIDYSTSYILNTDHVKALRVDDIYSSIYTYGSFKTGSNVAAFNKGMKQHAIYYKIGRVVLAKRFLQKSVEKFEPLVNIKLKEGVCTHSLPYVVHPKALKESDLPLDGVYAVSQKIDGDFGFLRLVKGKFGNLCIHKRNGVVLVSDFEYHGEDFYCQVTITEDRLFVEDVFSNSVNSGINISYPFFVRMTYFRDNIGNRFPSIFVIKEWHFDCVVLPVIEDGSEGLILQDMAMTRIGVVKNTCCYSIKSRYTIDKLMSDSDKKKYGCDIGEFLLDGTFYKSRPDKLKPDSEEAISDLKRGMSLIEYSLYLSKFKVKTGPVSILDMCPITWLNLIDDDMEVGITNPEEMKRILAWGFVDVEFPPHYNDTLKQRFYMWRSMLLLKHSKGELVEAQACVDDLDFTLIEDDEEDVSVT